MKAKIIWILVADGAHARIVRQTEAEAKAGDRGQVDDLVFEIDHKQLRDIMSDRPGRSFASEGARRSAMEYHSDAVLAQKTRFAATLLEDLAQRHAAGEFEQLVIVAESRMLGLIRRKLSPALRQTVIGEIAKDLTKLSRQELWRMVSERGIVRRNVI